MRRWHHLILPVALIALCSTDTGCAFRRRAQARAQAEREVVYQTVLRSYSEALQPGVTRKTTEDYLRGRNTAFRHPSLFFYQEQNVREPTAATDVVKIGDESAPYFFCTPMGIYIGLVFVATDKRHSLSADDSDVLQQVMLFRWAQCKDFQVLFDEPTKPKS